MMSGIRGKDTKPEMQLRKSLFARGFRYRLHPKSLPGKPDIVFPKYKAAIFVNGCFWHGHNCHLFKMPSTRSEFWKEKFNQNQKRDEEVQTALLGMGWRILVIWECALKGKTRLSLDLVIDQSSEWIRNGNSRNEIKGEIV